MRILKTLPDAIKNNGLSFYVKRLLMSLLLCSIVLLALKMKLFYQADFIIGGEFAIFAAALLAAFIALCFLKNDKIVSCGVVALSWVYFAAAAASVRDALFSFGVSAVMCAIFIFVMPEREVKLKKRKLLYPVITFIAVLWIVFVGGMGCVFYLDMRTSCYDFGIFSQMFYYMKETGAMLTTCERDGLLSHFAVHFSPIYYLILPFYCIFSSPCTLQIAQAVVIASGVFPAVAICRKKGLSDSETLFAAFIYFLYPAFMDGCFYWLHENCFLVPFILWMLYFSEEEKTGGTLIFTALTLLIKEDAFVYIVMIALYFIISGKRPVFNGLLLLGAIVWFIGVSYAMSAFGLGIMSYRYKNFIYDGGGLFSVIKSVVMNPALVIHEIFKADKIAYILQMTAPLLFMPFYIKKPRKLLLLVPFILVNLMPDYVYQYDIGFQYNFGSGAILYYLSVLNYSEREKRDIRVLICAVLTSSLFFAGGSLKRLGALYDYKQNTEARNAINYAISLVPEDAGVSVSTFFLPNMSQRREVYELETTLKRPEYVVIDLRYGDDYLKKYRGNGYRTVYFLQNTVAVLRNSAE